LEPEFSDAVMRELKILSHAAAEDSPAIHDLTDLLWCSIDNDDSLDLDQLTVCEKLRGGGIKMLVAIADVDALVKKDCAIDQHARVNTTSVYTSGRIYPMLPEQLSTGLTSLNLDEDRLVVVTEMTFHGDGALAASNIYRARVRNKAKLAYDAVSDWIDGKADQPAMMPLPAGMEDQLRTQDALAQQLRARRHAEGSLEFETFQPRAVFEGEKVIDIRQQVQNRARQLIEEVMIAANGCSARYLAAKGITSLRRVVQSPERWLRIVQLAKNFGEVLPEAPDSKALEIFLAKRHKADPLRFPDLSLTVIKLMGRGEYVAGSINKPPIGHFGLAVLDYMHSTAPNRRFPDLIASRQLKAAIAGQPSPYSSGEIEQLALHCSLQEAAAQKVERQLRKSEAVLLLESHIGQAYDAIVTGNTPAGIWVRILVPPVEGKLIHAPSSLNVGERVRVKLVDTNFDRGFIDFALLEGGKP
jgi:exoribonuclease-2